MRILQIKIGKLQVFRVHYTLKTRQIDLIMPENAILNLLVTYYQGITLERYVLDVKNNYSKFVLNHIHQQLQRQLSN